LGQQRHSRRAASHQEALILYLDDGDKTLLAHANGLDHSQAPPKVRGAA
jgi:hypothetical protein